MIKSRVLTSFILSFLAISFYKVDAQSGGIKFGKIDKKYLEMTTYEKDSGAAAVILADYGSSTYSYNQTKSGFQITFKRHRRIKILKKEGYVHADHSIPFYHNGGDKEIVATLKGYTHNFVNGKIEKHKLEKSAVFTEKRSDHWDIKKFSMPNVSEGSVIEYSYSVTSDFISNLRDWQFQYSVPSLWSEYTVSIPEYLNFELMSQGYLPLLIHEKKTSAGVINIPYKSQSGRLENEAINYLNYSTRMAMKDIPAIKTEEFITNINNYVSKMEFQLASTNFPNSAFRPHLGTWESLNTKLLENPSFGYQFNRKAFLKQHAAKIAADYDNPVEQANAAMLLVKNEMEWNDTKSIWVNTNIKKAFEEGSGNCADINLALIVLLRNLNIEANPIILSTRDNRMVHPVFPILDRFNYVIAHVVIDGKEILLDATSSMQPFGHLPHRCMNGQGRLISKTGTRWVDLRNSEKFSTFTKVNLNIDKSNTFTGSVESTCAGFSASELRKKIIAKGKDSYIEEQATDYDGLGISDYEITNLDQYNESLSETFNVSLNEYAMPAGNIIYIDPMLSYGTVVNPFKIEERLYPVDFGCPTSESYIFSFPIPEGYSVEEAPENAYITLPNKAGSFRYSISLKGNKITLVSLISIKQTLFLPNEYASIKQFFNLIVAKHAEQIVLKKNT